MIYGLYRHEMRMVTEATRSEVDSCDVVRMGTIEEYVDLNGSHMVIYFRLYSSFTTRVTNGVFADAVSEDDDTAWATV